MLIHSISVVYYPIECYRIFSSNML